MIGEPYRDSWIDKLVGISMAILVLSGSVALIGFLIFMAMGRVQ